MKTLYKIDQFGIPISLTIEGEEKHKSFLGSCLTLFTIGFGLIICYFLGQDFFYQTNPYVTNNVINNENPNFLNLSKGNYPFMIQTKFNEQDHNNPNNGFRINATYMDISINEDSSWTINCDSSINNLTICTDTKAKELESYTSKDLSNWLCLDIKKIEDQCKQQTKNEIYEVELGGGPGDKTSKYINFYLTNFNYDEAGKFINLVPIEEINDFVDIGLRFPTYYFNNKIPGNSLKTIPMQEQIYLKKTEFLYESIELNMVTLNDDSGWLLESFSKTNSMAHERTKPSFWNTDFYQGGSHYFYMNTINLNKKEIEFNRRYMKIQDVLAVSSGFIKLFASLCYFINNYFETRDRTNRLIESLFKSRLNNVREASVEEVVIRKNESSTSIVNLPKTEIKNNFCVRYLGCLWRQAISTKMSKEYYEQAKKYIDNCFDAYGVVRIHVNVANLNEFLLTSEQKEKVHNYIVN